MIGAKYRHRITVQSLQDVRDPVTGYREPQWVARVENEPAQFLAGPGREYLAGEALRSEVSGRFLVRWSPATAAIQASDRVLWDGRVMVLSAPPLPDATGRRELTLMVREVFNADAD